MKASTIEIKSIYNKNKGFLNIFKIFILTNCRKVTIKRLITINFSNLIRKILNIFFKQANYLFNLEFLK